jgi:hypothetical protein
LTGRNRPTEGFLKSFTEPSQANWCKRAAENCKVRNLRHPLHAESYLEYLDCFRLDHDRCYCQLLSLLFSDILEGKAAAQAQKKDEN